jgi:hypothetical protein
MIVQVHMALRDPPALVKRVRQINPCRQKIINIAGNNGLDRQVALVGLCRAEESYGPRIGTAPLARLTNHIGIDQVPTDGSAVTEAKCEARANRGGNWHWEGWAAYHRGGMPEDFIGALEGFRVALDMDGWAEDEAKSQQAGGDPGELNRPCERGRNLSNDGGHDRRNQGPPESLIKGTALFRGDQYTNAGALCDGLLTKRRHDDTAQSLSLMRGFSHDLVESGNAIAMGYSPPRR